MDMLSETFVQVKWNLVYESVDFRFIRPVPGLICNIILSHVGVTMDEVSYWILDLLTI
jgi:hypothetical protein